MPRHTVELPTPTGGGSYRFEGWSDGSGTYHKETYPVPDTGKDITLTDAWTYTGGGGGTTTYVVTVFLQTQEEGRCVNVEAKAVQTRVKPVHGNAFRDLTGRQFGRLTAIEPTGKKAADGCYYWLCRCVCGNYAQVSSNKLLQGKTVSCGCYGRERREESRTYIAGTCLEIVQSPKIPKNNTSGVKGVSRSRGMWMAKISFARKQFFLGRYKNFEEAVAVYRKAEALRDEVLEDINVLGDSAVNVLTQRLEEMRTGLEGRSPVNMQRKPGAGVRKKDLSAAWGQEGTAHDRQGVQALEPGRSDRDHI